MITIKIFNEKKNILPSLDFHSKVAYYYWHWQGFQMKAFMNSSKLYLETWEKVLKWPILTNLIPEKCLLHC